MVRVTASTRDGEGGVRGGGAFVGGAATPSAGQSERAAGTSTRSAGTLHSQKPRPNDISSTWKTITPVQPTRAPAPPRRRSSPSTTSPAASASNHGTGWAMTTSRQVSVTNGQKEPSAKVR